jgi:hypothetical protein
MATLERMKLLTVPRIVLSILVLTFASAWLAGAAAAATEPAVVGATSSSASLSGTTSVAVSGNYAFAASYWSGQLNVIDISNPANPTPVASAPSTPGTVPGLLDATNVAIAGNFAFVTSKNRNGTCTPGPIPSCASGSNDDGSGNSLTIVNISNPLAPSVVGTVHSNSTTTPFPDALFGAYAVAVSGNYAFVASQGLLSGQPTSPDTSAGSFTVIDLTSPSSPTIVASIDNASLTGALAGGLNHATGVSISGSYAYVTAFYGQRVTAINIATPTSPSVVASLRDPVNLAAPNDVTTQGNYAYVANQVNTGGMEFSIVNISNPFAPAFVGSVTDPTLVGAYRVRIHGNLVYVSANGASSVAAIDVSNPSAPRLAGAITDARLANVDGLAVSSTGRYLVATSPRLASDPAAAYPPFPTNTGTVSVIDLEPSPLSVTIASNSKPANPTSQNSANFSFAVSDAVTTVQCSLDGVSGPCTSATSASYGPLGSGTHTFIVTATDATGATAQATYAWTIGAAQSAAPHNNAAPKISGTAQQGRKLTATSGVWSGTPSPTYSYQWERCNAKGKSCKSISKQTSTSYTVTTADVGSSLDVVVRARNSAGSATATSAATKSVKWSSVAFASATLSKSKTNSPGITLSITSPGGNLKLSKLVISLPKGIAFHATKHALATGITVKDLHGKRLVFTAALSHGKLTLTFKKPPTGVKLTVARGLVSISAALEGRIKSRKAKTETVSLTAYYAGKPSRQAAIKFRLA